MLLPESKAVFLFTKDRLQNVSDTLKFLSGCPVQIFIIDDSTKPECRFQIKSIVNSIDNADYVGEDFYKEFTRGLNIQSQAYDYLIRKLGQEKWNLGYSRNLALLIAKKMKFQKVAFIDDDIIINDISLISQTFSLLDTHSFVGSEIIVLEDHSVVGHIAQRFGLPKKEMISGGFMFFKPSEIRYWFLNIYNEDWIWILTHLKNSDFLIKDTVKQNYQDPFAKGKIEIAFQEFGEIIMDGFWLAYENNEVIASFEEVFWKEIVATRIKYLNLLKKNTQINHDRRLMQLVEYAILAAKSIKLDDIKITVDKYFCHLDNFERLYKRI